MRIVLDSNVIISAFISRAGICNFVYELCILRNTIFLSKNILDEVQDRLLKKFKYGEKDVREAIFHLTRNSQILTVVIDEKIVVRDKKDKHILSLAEHARADIIVTGDKDLLVVKKFKGTEILSPKEFWLKYS